MRQQLRPTENYLSNVADSGSLGGRMSDVHHHRHHQHLVLLLLCVFLWHWSLCGWLADTPGGQFVPIEGIASVSVDGGVGDSTAEGEGVLDS